VLRGQRNREAVVEALLGLVSDGVLNPTAMAIAARAGISRRSVFQHFADVESIYEAAGRRVGSNLGPLLEPVDTSLPLATRIAALAAVRRSLLEEVDPIVRAAAVREPFSPQLQANRRRFSALMLGQCRQTFAPELARRPPGDAEEVALAIQGALSWSLFNHLRSDLQLSDGQTRAVMTRLVAGLLGVDEAEEVDLFARCPPGPPGETMA
jgi:TetR/AcrR family transcriptional regulator of autoinduction and epiphytic fitness